MKLQLSMLALGAHEDDTEAQTMNRLQVLIAPRDLVCNASS